MKLILTGLVLLMPLTTLAAAAGGQPQRLRDNPEVRALFERFRATESESHQARIRILQQAESCIRQVRDRKAYRRCEREEGAARRAARERTRTQREAIREEAMALRERLSAMRQEQGPGPGQ